MNITDEIIDYISDLSKIKLDSSEKQRQKETIQSVIGFMEVLNLLNTSQLENTDNSYLPINVFRQDCINEHYKVEDILANALDCQDNYYKVPKIIN